MRRINLTLDRQGEANLRVLKMHGYSNVSELVRQLISDKVENIKQGSEINSRYSNNSLSYVQERY